MSINLLYLLSSVVAFVVLGYLTLLAIWEISKNEKGLFFTNMKEGTGTFIMDGGKAGRIILAMRGHSCELVEEKRPIRNKQGEIVGEKILQREKIIAVEQSYSPGILGWLERSYGIYWVGLPPKSRMKKMFKWNEWKQEEAKTKEGESVKNVGGKVVTYLHHREEETNFFFAQTFPYGVKLEGAETGGTRVEGKDEIGGNISVDVEIDLFLRIVYPRIAVFMNQDWFDQLGSIVLDHARLYVGKHPYEKLRSQAETPSGLPTHNEFSEYIMKLNEYASIGENYASVIDALGVQIDGAQIRTVSLSEESKGVSDATMRVYVAEQDKLAEQLKGDGQAYVIRTRSQAETDALTMKINAVKAGGEDGKLVLNSQTLIDVGQHGNTFVTSGGTPFILNTNKTGG